MSDRPLVTVIIPCFNVAEFVVSALVSIVNQSYDNLEILVVDDASTDNTLQEVKTIEDSRIKVIEFKQNTLKIGAVNKALEEANGRYIAFQDADDWSEPKRIESQVNAFMDNPKLGVCFTGYRNFGAKHNDVKNIAYNDSDLRDEFLKFGNKANAHLEPTCCPSMMIRADLVKITAGYNPYFTGRVAEDVHWVFRLLNLSEGHTVNDILYNYQIREGSLTQNQLNGLNPKAAYTWQLLSKIIEINREQGIDILLPEHSEWLKSLELEACEDALVAQLKLNHNLKQTYEQSASLKLGRAILKPYHFLRNKL